MWFGIAPQSTVCRIARPYGVARESFAVAQKSTQSEVDGVIDDTLHVRYTGMPAPCGAIDARPDLQVKVLNAAH